jgi:hypothetical protein
MVNIFVEKMSNGSVVRRAKSTAGSIQAAMETLGQL